MCVPLLSAYPCASTHDDSCTKEETCLVFLYPTVEFGSPHPAAPFVWIFIGWPLMVRQGSTTQRHPRSCCRWGTRAQNRMKRLDWIANVCIHSLSHYTLVTTNSMTRAVSSCQVWFLRSQPISSHVRNHACVSHLVPVSAPTWSHIRAIDAGL